MKEIESLSSNKGFSDLFAICSAKSFELEEEIVSYCGLIFCLGCVITDCGNSEVPSHVRLSFEVTVCEIMSEGKAVYC
jgi:hypothetical protein